MPQALLFDLMAISDKYGTEIKKRLESHKAHGTWGDSKYIYGKLNLESFNQKKVGVSHGGKHLNFNPEI